MEDIDLCFLFMPNLFARFTYLSIDSLRFSW